MRISRPLPVSLLSAALAASLAVVVWGPAHPGTAAAQPVVTLTSDFEDGTTNGWGPRGSEVVANSTATAHGGTHSLLTSGRTASWQAPSRNVLSHLTKGTQFTFSVWVRLAAGQAPANAQLSLERRLAGTPSYGQVGGPKAVSDAAWTQLSGTYTLAVDADFAAVYVETSGGTPSLHIDDFVMSYVPATPIQTDIPSLKTVLAGDFPIGAAVGRPELLGEHARLLTKHFNSVTPGNSLKWDATEPTEGTFRYSDPDAIVAFAKANGIKVRGHTLVWHQQTPAWVFTDATGADMTATAANKALVLKRIENHIRAVAGRYANDIYAWDVANEVIDEGQADGMRRSRWFTLTGLDYLRTAFRVAREVAPNAKLYINDYNTNVPAKRDKLFALVSQLRAEGVPIDGVGHQMHVNVDWPSVTETEQMITKFIPLGVEQQITEMDISVYTNGTDSFPTISDALLIRQANRYRELFDVFRRHRASITSVTLWGLADDDTWLKQFPITRLDLPLLFDEQLQAKPAYWALVDPTRISASPSPGRPTTPASPTASVTASVSVPASASPSVPGGAGHQTLTARHSGKVAQAPGSANGTAIIQQPRTGDASQQWELRDAGAGYVTVVNRASGKCLDVAGRSLADRAAAIAWTCGTGTNQQWQLRPVDGGYVQLVARHSGKCLDVTDRSVADGAALIQWTCGSGTNQHWQRMAA
ncbi:MAG TPA: endo-1,4-beta-xylanase [Micromonosporaceae bacterium]|nr:endo-1,4-beta-xylanase [Micromonosporaceae bacterium]